MDSPRMRPGAPAAYFHERLGGPRLLVALLVPALLIASVALVRATAVTLRSESPWSAGAQAQVLGPTELRKGAADHLERATGNGGAGYSFEIIQHSTLVARPDGKPLQIPDPADQATLIAVPAVPLGTYLERGLVTPAGFFAEIRRGPDDPTAPDSWETAPMEMAALVRGGRTYRNDGDGWYGTAHPPGLGLDPATAARLPGMLRGLANGTDAALPADTSEPGRIKGDPFGLQRPTRRITGLPKVADIPGIIAVDLVDSTELVGPAELAFDDAGRLIGLRVTAKNTNVVDYDLLVDTIITIAYADAPLDLPKPDPAYREPTPAQDQGE